MLCPRIFRSTQETFTSIQLLIAINFCSVDFDRMDNPLSQEDVSAMEGQLRRYVEQDRGYWRVNDVKLDAIHTARTYEEFADRVAAAHLQPLEKKDYKAKKNSWNQYAAKEKESD